MKNVRVPRDDEGAKCVLTMTKDDPSRCRWRGVGWESDGKSLSPSGSRACWKRNYGNYE